MWLDHNCGSYLTCYKLGSNEYNAGKLYICYLVFVIYWLLSTIRRKCKIFEIMSCQFVLVKNILHCREVKTVERSCNINDAVQWIHSFCV